MSTAAETAAAQASNERTSVGTAWATSGPSSATARSRPGRVDVGQGEREAVGGEAVGGGETDPARTAGDQRDSGWRGGGGHQYHASEGPLNSWIVLPPSTTIPWPVT